MDSFSSSSSDSDSDVSSEEEKEGDKNEENIQITEAEGSNQVIQGETIQDLEIKIKVAEKIKDPGDLIERRKKSKKKSQIKSIIEQVRRLDKISYIERAQEFDVQLDKIEKQ